MKKVLILVLSMNEDYYNDLANTSMETWDSVDIEGMDTVFYFGQPKASDQKWCNKKIFYTGGDEALTNIGFKNLKVFEAALHNPDWDFIIRANASTYVNKKLVAEYVQDKPTKGLYMGVGAPYTLDGKEFYYAWGPHYLLSRDVVELIVENKDKWNHGLMDDVALGKLMTDLGISLNNKGSMASIDINRNPDKPLYSLISYNNNDTGGGNLTRLSDLNNFKLPMIRVKQDFNRNLDIELMKNIFKIIDR